MRKLLLILCLFFFTSIAIGQYKPILFGLKVGGNLGWMKADSDGYESTGIKPGFSWGFISEFFLMENYAILTGFNINFNSGKMEYPAPFPIGGDTLPIGILSRTYNLKYIQIPLCLKMQSEISEKVKIFGKLGIGTAFLLDAGARDSYTYEGIDYHNSKDIKDEMTLMRESLMIGGGVEIVLKGSTSVIIDLTYDNGINNIIDAENLALPGEQPRAFHNYLELGAGVIF